MCFSPEASFTASAVITTVGVVALKKSEDHPSKMLACIPLFFGIQQFAEGMVWLSLLYDQFLPFKSISTAGFILFAWVVWPFWIPFAIGGIEQNEKRKQIIKWVKYLGLFMTLALGYVLLFKNVQASIYDCSIIYNFNVSDDVHKLFGVLYLIVTIVPTILATGRWVWLLGVMNLLAYFGTKLFISDRILSIWCFFCCDN